MSNFETDNQDKSNLVGDVMSDAVDVEQERLALIDEVRELNKQLYFSSKCIVSLQEELALERAKAVSRNEFIGTVIGVDWDKDTYQKAKAWDDLEALVGLNISESNITRINYLGNLIVVGNGRVQKVGRNLSEAVSNALTSIRGES